jgi:hypothetical protein
VTLKANGPIICLLRGLGSTNQKAAQKGMRSSSTNHMAAKGSRLVLLNISTNDMPITGPRLARQPAQKGMRSSSTNHIAAKGSRLALLNILSNHMPITGPRLARQPKYIRV